MLIEKSKVNILPVYCPVCGAKLIWKDEVYDEKPNNPRKNFNEFTGETIKKDFGEKYTIRSFDCPNNILILNSYFRFHYESVYKLRNGEWYLMGQDHDCGYSD